jgi:hypothetical protein
MESGVGPSASSTSASTGRGRLVMRQWHERSSRSWKIAAGFRQFVGRGGLHGCQVQTSQRLGIETMSETRVAFGFVHEVNHILAGQLINELNWRCGMSTCSTARVSAEISALTNAACRSHRRSRSRTQASRQA